MTKSVRFVLSCALAAGCIDEVPELGEARFPVAAEQPGIVEIVSRYYGNPDVARVSFASASVPGCSAVMIGPTTLMTAAHCGIADHTQVTFYGYRKGTTLKSVETYDCRFILQSFFDSDLALADCPPPPVVQTINGPVQPPAAGDVFGYLDFTRTMPTEGQAVYSVWWNPLDSAGGADTMFYSAGTITETMGTGWYVPDGTPAWGTDSSTYCEPGCSGSPQLDAATHKILVGPTSVVSTTDRGALAAENYFRWASVVPFVPDTGVWTRNGPYLTSLGLEPDDYLGWVDFEIDGLFDLQTDLENLRGETARKIYWLGFESPRRNQLWWRSVAATITPSTADVRITVNTAAEVEVLAHRKLRGVTAAGTYRVRLTITTFIGAAGSTLKVALRNSGTTRASATIPLVTSGGPRTYTFTLSPTQAVNELSFLATGYVNVRIREVTLQQPASSPFTTSSYTNTFELADERTMWKNGNDGSTAAMRPDGNGAAANDIAFAGFVEKATGSSSTNNYPLENRHVPIVPGVSQRVCAQHRESPASSNAPSGDWGLIELRCGTTTVSSRSFRPTSSWTEACTDWHTPTAGDCKVRFGTFWPSSGTHAGKYLVDNMRLEAQ